VRVYVSGSRAFGAAVFQLVRERGHEVVGACSPPWSSGGGQFTLGEKLVGRRDRLRAAAEDNGVPWLPAGELNARTLPEDVDLLIAAHSHDFIGRKTRLRLKLGAIGYHPSLLPLHRGRDAVRWTIRDRDNIAGGTVYWLNDVVDGGPIAAQTWCFVLPGETAAELWRRELFRLGVAMFARVLTDLEDGVIVAVPQDERLATFEPAFDPPRLRRPDLLELGDGGWAGYSVRTDRNALSKEDLHGS
jgi:methionyl-tRNA formyltransferase